jgi:hypothetical protein
MGTISEMMLISKEVSEKVGCKAQKFKDVFPQLQGTPHYHLQPPINGLGPNFLDPEPELINMKRLPLCYTKTIFQEHWLLQGHLNLHSCQSSFQFNANL